MRPLLPTAIIACLAQPALAQQAGGGMSLSLTAGADYSTGDYGGVQDTDILVAPLSARLAMGDVRIMATLPYLRIDGGAIVGGGGGPIIIDPDAPRTTREGLGDVFLSAVYSALKEESSGVNLDIGAGVKLPTAEASEGLGTGETDYSVSADVSKTFGSITPFATLGYRVLGDPDGINLSNSFSASAGASIAFGESVAILSYDFRQSTVEDVEDAHDLFAAFSSPLSESINWTLYGSAGLSTGSPDFAAGLMLTFNLS